MLFSPQQHTVWPGEFIEITLPDSLQGEKFPVVIEPRPDYTNRDWPSPRLLHTGDGKVRILNKTSRIHKIPKQQYFCQVLAVHPAQCK